MVARLNACPKQSILGLKPIPTGKRAYTSLIIFTVEALVVHEV